MTTNLRDHEIVESLAQLEVTIRDLIAGNNGEAILASAKVALQRAERAEAAAREAAAESGECARRALAASNACEKAYAAAEWAERAALGMRNELGDRLRESTANLKELGALLQQASDNIEQTKRQHTIAAVNREATESAKAEVLSLLEEARQVVTEAGSYARSIESHKTSISARFSESYKLVVETAEAARDTRGELQALLGKAAREAENAAKRAEVVQETVAKAAADRAQAFGLLEQVEREARLALEARKTWREGLEQEATSQVEAIVAQAQLDLSPFTLEAAEARTRAETALREVELKVASIRESHRDWAETVIADAAQRLAAAEAAAAERLIAAGAPAAALAEEMRAHREEFGPGMQAAAERAANAAAGLEAMKRLHAEGLAALDRLDETRDEVRALVRQATARHDATKEAEDALALVMVEGRKLREELADMRAQETAGALPARRWRGWARSALGTLALVGALAAVATCGMRWLEYASFNNHLALARKHADQAARLHGAAAREEADWVIAESHAALALIPSSPSAHYQLARAYEVYGDRVGALREASIAGALATSQHHPVLADARALRTRLQGGR